MGELDPNLSVEEWHRLIVQTRQITLNDFITSQGSQIKSENVDDREKAFIRIVDVLTRFPHSFLMSDDVKTLLDFFLSVLETSALADGSIIKGINFLVLHCENLPENFEEPVFRKLFSEGNVQNWAKNERILLYEILQWFLNNKLALMQALQNDFVVAFMKSIASERDPNCLVHVFKLFIQVSKNIAISPYEEEMFETIACYFPVEFKPKQDDMITREYLATLCACCLVACSRFSMYCYMLIDEKLNEEDDMIGQQLDDVLDLLVLATENFKPQDLVDHLEQLLSGIRKAAVNPNNKGKMPVKCEDALKAIINSCKEVPNNNGIELTRMMIENVEPLVLQAEMGLSSNVLRLLKVMFVNLPDVSAKTVLEHAISWVLTLVQGSTVRAAGNKHEIVTEGLQYLLEWIKMAMTKPEIGRPSLESNESAVFASCDVAREFVPVLALEAIYDCAEIYLKHDMASVALIDRITALIEAQLVTPSSISEINHFMEMVFQMSEKHWNRLHAVFEKIPLNTWNDGKVIGVLCSAAGSRWESWNYVKPLILASLEENPNRTGTIAFCQLCIRASPDDDLVWDRLMMVDEIVMKEQADEATYSQYLQQISLRLSTSNHEKFMNFILEKLENNRIPLTSRKYILSLLQDENPLHIRKLLTYEFSTDLQLKVLFSAINRKVTQHNAVTGCTMLDYSINHIKAMLLSETAAAIPFLATMLHHVYTHNGENMDIRFHYLLDYDVVESNPEFCRYQTAGPLWRQRIFYMVVRCFIDSYIAAGQDRDRLLPFLPPLLMFAQKLNKEQVKTQYQLLLPILISSLNNLTENDPIPPSILRAAPIFLTSSDSLEKVDLDMIVNKFCFITKIANCPMENLMNSLESLRILASRQPPANMHSLITTVVNAMNDLLDHRKRVVRHKCALVKNQWENLVSK